jgi:hypothetical protein
LIQKEEVDNLKNEKGVGSPIVNLNQTKTSLKIVTKRMKWVKQVTRSSQKVA